MNMMLLYIPFIKLEIFTTELCFTVKTKFLDKALIFLKNHHNCQFKILTCISGVDFPKNQYRFAIVYEILSLRFNNRIRIKCFVNEISPINSVQNIFTGAGWWECEIWDMFGVFFSKHQNLVRLLTDYGFEGYPLRKDFPLSGFYEARYSYTKHRVVYGNIELCQEYRTFEYPSPWERSN